MTIRLDVNIANTEQLLGAILEHTNSGERVMFLCDSGRGQHVQQRVRVKLSRLRKQMARLGKRRRHFKLACSIHPHTEHGLRFDCVVMWQTQDESHKTIEIVEDIIGHGQII